METFTVAISTTVYHSTISEAITIFVVTVVAAIISLIMLFHTAYKCMSVHIQYIPYSIIVYHNI